MTGNELAASYTAAWNTRRPDDVAAFFAQNGTIAINNGSPWQGRDGVAQMAAGFYADIPDLRLTCDGLRRAGDHLLNLCSFEGTHAGTGNAVKVSGWEKWDIKAAGMNSLSRGWFDAEDYARQTQSRQR